MAGDDPLLMANALAFLLDRWPYRRFDDDPLRTARDAAQIIDRLAANPPDPKFRSEYRLLTAIANAGPAARPHVRHLIDGAGTPITWDRFRQLALVGGEEAMTQMVRVLPHLREIAERAAPIDADLDTSSDLPMEARNALLAYRGCRWAIERWAGRGFKTDAEIERWWNAAKSRTQRDWLTDALAATAAAADAGDAKAQYLIRCILPDLPHAEDDEHIDPPWSSREVVRFKEQRRGPYRVRWLNEHRAKLGYDEQQSCYRLQAER